MTIAVVGGGAMGGVWSARLSSAGMEVGIVDISESLVGAIRAGGMTIESSPTAATTTAWVDATTNPADLGPRDLVFVFVKGPHTGSAAAAMAPLVGPTTTVVSLQNGWGNADALAAHVPSDRLVVGVTYEGASIRAPGVVANNGHGPTYLGPYQEPSGLDRASAVGAAMQAAGFETVVTSAVKTEIWRKLVHNAACLGVSALTDLRTAELVEQGTVRDLVDDLAREAAAVARAQGYDIDPEERIARIHAVLEAAGLGIPSMLADARAHRPTEIQTINGAIVRAAQAHGVPAPLNSAIVALVTGLERGWAR